jgi:hypothetical protein
LIIVATSTKARTDDWYGTLHRDRIVLDISEFHIHPRPSIVYSIIGLGVLASPAYLFPKSLAISGPVFFSALVIKLEVVILVLRWFLEMYATTAPRKINILWWLSTSPETHLGHMQERDMLFHRLYAPSKLTISIRQIFRAALATAPPAVGMFETTDPIDQYPELAVTAPRRLQAWEVERHQPRCVSEPWNITEVKIFEASTNHRNEPGDISLCVQGILPIKMPCNYF